MHFRSSTVLFLLVLTSTSTFAQQAPAALAERYGVNDDYMAPLPASIHQQARAAGYAWVNYTLYWNLVNPAGPCDSTLPNGGPGCVYDWSGPDVAIQRIVDAGLNPLVRIRYPPTWATGDTYPTEQVPFYCPMEATKPPQLIDPQCRCRIAAAGVQGVTCDDPNWQGHIPSDQAFPTFVTAAINRYKDRVRFWGFGEESHNPYLWVGTQADLVTRMLRPGYVTAKAIDPGLTVVGPDEDWADSLEGLLLLEQTHGRWADVISFHVLSGSRGSVQLLDDPQSGPHSLLKPVLDRLGAGRPLWLTELGAPSRGEVTTDPVQAAWLRDQLALVFDRPWIDKVFIYRLVHGARGTDDYGILHADGTPKEAFTSTAAFLATQSTPRVSYLAEGALGIFELDVCLANPTSSRAPVKVSFLRDNGTVVTLPLVLAPMSRHTVHVNDVPGVAGSLSTVVESTSGAPVLTERTMFWGTKNGGHTGSSVQGGATRWYFAEGSQGIFDTFLLLANDNIVPAVVTIKFLRERELPLTLQRTVAPRSRDTIWAGDVPALVNRSFSIQVDADQPIIAERAMYFGGPMGSWKGGHESAGVTALSTSWYHAEGATGDEFDTYILIGNPGSVDARVRLTFYLANGQTIELERSVPAEQRMTLNLELEHPALARTAVSTKVESLDGVPVVSERAMYWPGGFGTWEEGHNSVGVTAPGVKWGLAEGRVGGAEDFETYILIANSNPTPATVQATFLRTNGAPVVREFTVAATSRFTLAVTRQPWSSAPDLVNEQFATVIESVGPNREPVVVEQAIYWSATRNGQVIPRAGGSNVAATPLP